MALLQDAPSPVTLMAAAPDGCVVASLGRQDLQSCLGDAETILSRRFGGDTDEAQGVRSPLGLQQVRPCTAALLPFSK
ncbi:hypothetical protein ACSSS7_000830 [Eimeria intestinalis]